MGGFLVGCGLYIIGSYWVVLLGLLFGCACLLSYKLVVTTHETVEPLLEVVVDDKDSIRTSKYRRKKSSTTTTTTPVKRPNK